MLAAAAFVPTPPLLVPEIAGGSAGNDDSLRADCRAAVQRLLSSGVEEVAVVGDAPGDGELHGGWDWRGFGTASPADPPAQRLPLALAVGDWLLDLAGADQPRSFHGVSE